MTRQDELERAYPSAEGRKGPREIETTRARQGEAPGHMRYVLIASTALVVAAFVAIYLLYFW